MKHILKRKLFYITLAFLLFAGIIGSEVIAQEYTGRGVPIDVATGMPADTFPIVTDGTVHCVIPDESGGWFIGGSFTTVGGISRTAVARIKSDGSVDASWNANVNNGGVVYALKIGGTGNSMLYIGGSFTQVGGTDRNNIARVVISSGALDVWYLENGASGIVYAIEKTFASNIVLGGDFSYTVGSNTYVNLIQINNAGTIATQVGDKQPVNGTIRSLKYGSQLSLLVGGDFTEVVSFSTSYPRGRAALFQWDVDFGYILANWNPNANGTVRTVSFVDNIATPTQPDILIGGDFTTVSGQSRNKLAKVGWSGILLPWGPNVSGTGAKVYWLSLRDTSTDTVYVGGSFESINGETRYNIAAIELSSGALTAWDPKLDGTVRTLSASIEYVYAGGEFDSLGTGGGGGGGEPGTSELLFAADSRLRLDNSTFTDTLQLVYNGTDELNGLQFRLRSNPSDAGSVDVLSLASIVKGSNIASENWNFDFEFVSDAGGDYFNVVLYGEGTTTLPQGTYNDLVRFTYETDDIIGADTVRSYFRLEEIYSSFINGNPAGVIGDEDQIVDVYGVEVADSLLGDINLDGEIDINDLLLIRDYILERITFDSGEFERADIAPWTAGDPEPSPDGKVNVQDLSLLQHIIFTGQYPSEELIANPYANPYINLLASSSIYNLENATTVVTLAVSNDGIEITTNSEHNIIGMQLEFNGIENIGQSIVIQTELGQAYYYHNAAILKTLFYDRAGNIALEQGQNYIGTIPVQLTKPENLIVTKIVLINDKLEKIKNIGVNVTTVTDVETELPVEYSLSQNYPNPFNPSTTIEFSLKQRGDVTIKIYNMLGQEVRTLYADQLESGNHRVVWDGMNNQGMMMSSGTYIYKMISGDFVQSKKMLLIK